MPVSKVNFGSQTLIDLTSDTVTEDTLLMGTTAHDAAGNSIVGTFKEFVKLWENSDITANFAPQTITLDLSTYQFVMVGFKYSKATADRGTTAVIVRVGDNLLGVASMIGSLAPSVATDMVRRAFDVSASGINFNAGYRKTTTSTSTTAANNQYLIPMYIYGIR